MSDDSAPVELEDLLERDASQAASLVAAARRLLSEGRFLDLAALEGRIGALCGRIADMPKAEARRFADFLEALDEELAQLAIDIEARHTLLALERGGTASAYQRLD
jgi:hypothetical protein